MRDMRIKADQLEITVRSERFRVDLREMRVHILIKAQKREGTTLSELVRDVSKLYKRKRKRDFAGYYA